MFDTVLALNSSYVEGFLNRASAQQRLGELAGASADLKHAVSLQPKNPDTYFALALNNAQQGSFVEALDCLTNAAARGYSDPLLFLVRGKVKIALRDTSGACMDFSYALQKGLQEATSLSAQFCR